MTRIINFCESIAAGEEKTISKRIPLDGKITNIQIFFPTTDYKLGVAVGYESTRICPETGFLTLDSANPSFTIDEPIKKNQRLWVDLRNEGSASFVISAIITIQGEKYE